MASARKAPSQLVAAAACHADGAGVVPHGASCAAGAVAGSGSGSNGSCCTGVAMLVLLCWFRRSGSLA